ncbi:hypothetical protein EHS25_006012 [Saitozyma podzolica]|uniref:Uncharacterized protein n=1 Tax=Saitozyma podzolica TaxID=1890683 RepID=A0A427XTT8_9TREE|nr:hypothetical protein EHS25_006012 [Saitozyma podzolica]
MSTSWDANVTLTGNVFDADPYLAYQPAFAYTLPIQLLVAGITVTLLCVLLIHLLFTTQYHYPLAPLNYILQLSSILVVLISMIIKIVVILNNSADNADVWPYDLDYVAVPIPPDSWSVGQDAAWFLLQALNNGLSNITHIQFLTLLYPSRVEARLIIFILGPLAITSSALAFTALSGSQTVLDVGDAIRNVLNSTLLLIFTTSLFIWGFLVNRRRAWRFDGGTAMFGIGSLFLAVISTTFNFVAVKEDGIDWLQHLLFAAILWQIWLGWWWWVGSGMGIGEVEDLMERAEKRKRKAAKRAARQRSTTQIRARSASLAQNITDAPAAALSGLSNSVAGILRNRTSTLTRRRRSQSIASGQPAGDVEEGIELESLGTGGRPRRTDSPQSIQVQGRTSAQGPNQGQTSSQPHVEFSEGTVERAGLPSTNSETSSTSATPSLHAPRSVGQFLALPTIWLQIYLRRLRRAHENAATRQALERAELRQRVFAAGSGANGGAGLGGRHGVSGNGEGVAGDTDGGAGGGEGGAPLRAARAEAAVVEGDGIGWGLGSFGIKEQREGARRLAEAGQMMRQERLLGEVEELEEANDNEAKEGDGAGDAAGQAGPSRRRRGSGTATGGETSAQAHRGDSRRTGRVRVREGGYPSRKEGMIGRTSRLVREAERARVQE